MRWENLADNMHNFCSILYCIVHVVLVTLMVRSVFFKIVRLIFFKLVINSDSAGRPQILVSPLSLPVFPPPPPSDNEDRVPLWENILVSPENQKHYFLMSAPSTFSIKVTSSFVALPLNLHSVHLQ